jgi:hypothetical protein
VFEGFPRESDVAILGGDDCVLLLYVVGDRRDRELAIMRIRGSELWNMFTAVYCAHWPPRAPDYVGINPRVRWCKIYASRVQKDCTVIERLIETKAELLDYNTEHLEDEISNWPSEGLLSEHTFLPPLAIATSTALYGGLHAATWHSFFPTEVEKWFWHISSIVIAASGLLVAIVVGSDHLYRNIRFKGYRPSVRWAARALKWVAKILSLKVIDDSYEAALKFVVILCCSLGACCVIARVYLVVESFISLRKMPVEIYQTPDWTQWIPHL